VETQGHLPLGDRCVGKPLHSGTSGRLLTCSACEGVLLLPTSFCCLQTHSPDTAAAVATAAATNTAVVAPSAGWRLLTEDHRIAVNAGVAERLRAKNVQEGNRIHQR
jgi:hypothetical protein